MKRVVGDLKKKKVFFYFSSFCCIKLIVHNRCLFLDFLERIVGQISNPSNGSVNILLFYLYLNKCLHKTQSSWCGKNIRLNFAIVVRRIQMVIWDFVNANWSIANRAFVFCCHYTTIHVCNTLLIWLSLVILSVDFGTFNMFSLLSWGCKCICKGFLQRVR